LATDGELVRRARLGEPAAYDQLARRWAARVLAVCHARVGHAGSGGRAAAEDLAQESLLRGLRSLPTLADPEKFGPWLVGIAVRTCLDWLKSAQRTEVSLDDAPVSAARADDDVRDAMDRRERAEQLVREVERLPHAYREVLMLYYYQDCTYQDLADVLGVSSATINARLTKARAMLRARMMAEQDLLGD
jgi:RNA polymerase sigma factor (sigma-70 family)